ncbi:MAG: chitobiase/beta-hexosaminidase C-terminal domain-containing protein [Ekhidna sp.]|nr:chitobiase/beta-hexosaminidase C-terminal domain-containing protein [Ekhidna sp.]
MSLRITTLLVLTTFSLQLVAQNDHEKKIYKNSEGKVYVNKALPVYLSVSSDREGADSEILEGKEPKYSSPMYLDSEGYNTIRSPWQVDPETKKIASPKAEVIFELWADSQAPKTTIDYNADKLYTKEGTVFMKGGEITLSATDQTAGVADIYYSLNNGSFTKYQNGIKLADEAVTTLKYYAVDNVGNVEEVSSSTISIDNSPPVSSMAVAGDKIEDVLSSRSTISLEAKDNLAEKSKIFYSIDEGRTYSYSRDITISGLSEGEHTLTYFAVDDVDNNEEKRTYNFFLDKSAPRVIDEVIGNTFIANGKEYYSGRTKLKIVSMDNKAGVKEVTYSINGGEFKKYDTPFYLTEPGNLSIEVMAIDKVNNRKRTSAFSGKNNTISYVDLAGPSLSNSVAGPSYTVQDTLFISKDTKIRLKGSDSESGFKEIDYQIDNGSSETYTEPFSVEKDGFHKISYNGYDNLSNSSTETMIFMVDNQGPEIFNRFSINSSKSKEVEGKKVPVYPPHVVLFLSSTDKGVGLDKISYQINGGSMLPYRSLIENFRKNTLYTINASVIDKLGNENQQEISFYIE